MLRIKSQFCPGNGLRFKAFSSRKRNGAVRLGRFLAPYILLAVFKADTKPFVGLMSSVLKKRENQRAFVAHVKSATVE